MAVTYTWTLRRPLVVAASFTDPATGNTYPNVVIEVHWSCSATDGTNTASTYGSVPIPWSRVATFTPLTNLTKAIIADWVQGALATSEVRTIAQIKASLAGQLAAMAAPKTVQFDLPAT